MFLNRQHSVEDVSHFKHLIICSSTANYIWAKNATLF